jgi:hypothetical protein
MLRRDLPEFENWPVPVHPEGQLLLQNGAVPSQYVLQPACTIGIVKSTNADAARKDAFIVESRRSQGWELVEKC